MNRLSARWMLFYVLTCSGCGGRPFVHGELDSDGNNLSSISARRLRFPHDSQSEKLRVLTASWRAHRVIRVIDLKSSVDRIDMFLQCVEITPTFDI